MANAMLDARQEGDSYRRIEVITGQRRRRRWTAEEKVRIVAESFEADANISEVVSAQRRCPWATHGLATPVCSSSTQQGAKLRAGPDCRGERWRDNWRAGQRCAGADESAGARSRPRRGCSATRRRCRCSIRDDAAPGDLWMAPSRNCCSACRRVPDSSRDPDFMPSWMEPTRKPQDFSRSMR
jgi:Transposase